MAMRAIRNCLLLSILLLSSAAAAQQTEMEMRLDIADLVRFSPSANREIVETLTTNRDLLLKGEINSRLRLAHFLAQVATETGGMRRLDENLNHSEQSLLRTFSRARVAEAKAKELASLAPRAHKERSIANWIYGDMLGNQGRDTDDGWNYRGSGYIQLTGRGNYRDRGKEVNLPLEETPDLARKSYEGLVAAIAYWSANDINSAADDNDIQRVRVLVNGRRAHGLPAAKLWFNRAQAIYLRSDDVPKGRSPLESGTGAETSAVAEALQQLGFLTSQAAESSGSVSDALKAFQRDRGLSETGVLDDDTLYAITDPIEWRPEAKDDRVLHKLDPESTQIYDVASSKTSNRASPSTSATTSGAGRQPSASLAGNAGTGKTESALKLTAGEIRNFANARATYSPYEKIQGHRRRNDTFLPFSIVGRDDRVVVGDTRSFPARAVVEISFIAPKTGERQLCSGAMVSTDTVLTAGHCVHEGTSDGQWHADVTVYPGRNGAVKPFGHCGAKQLLALGGWVGSADWMDARYYDLGAIKLDCDVGSRTGWFGIRALADDAIGIPVIVQGYPVDKAPLGRQWESRDQLRHLLSLNAFYQNDTWGGMSGSPVYQQGDNRIFGVHTNGLHGSEPWKSNNAATRITQERLKTVMQWIEG